MVQGDAYQIVGKEGWLDGPRTYWSASNALVESGAGIGDGTAIWDYTQVRSTARIGRDCTIGRNVYIDASVTLGDGCKVQNNALIYGPACLGNGVFIGPGVILTNDRLPRAITPLGLKKGTEDWVAAGITVADGASIGAGAVVVGGVKIGAWALVGAGALVSRDVPDYALVVGTPARRIAWVGPAGKRLVAGDPDCWICPESGQTFVEEEGQLQMVKGATS